MERLLEGYDALIDSYDLFKEQYLKVKEEGIIKSIKVSLKELRL